jgi:hypothetical protein
MPKQYATKSLSMGPQVFQKFTRHQKRWREGSSIRCTHKYWVPPYKYWVPPYKCWVPPYKYWVPPYKYWVPPYKYWVPPYKIHSPGVFTSLLLSTQYLFHDRVKITQMNWRPTAAGVLFILSLTNTNYYLLIDVSIICFIWHIDSLFQLTYR